MPSRPSGLRKKMMVSAQLSLLLECQRCRKEARAATQEKLSLQIQETEGNYFGARKEKTLRYFPLPPRSLWSNGGSFFLPTFCSGATW